jgi:hypothetical protein
MFPIIIIIIISSSSSSSSSSIALLHVVHRQIHRNNYTFFHSLNQISGYPHADQILKQLSRQRLRRPALDQKSGCK